MARKKKREKKKSRARSQRRFQSEKLKKRMKKSRDRATGGQKSIIKGDIPTWRPKDGSHIIDIIPYAAGSNDPQTEKGDPTYTFETHRHIRVGPNNQTFLCLETMYNKPCPICEHRDKLREKGAEEEKWKPLFPKVWHLYNVVCYDKGEEKKGVQVWEVPWFYSEKHLQALAKRPSRGGKKSKEIIFADEEDGRSVSFTIEPGKGKESYPSYVGWAFDERDYKIDEDILDSAYCLDEIIQIPSYDDVAEAYWGESHKKKSRGKGKDKDEDEDEELDEALEELEDLEDMEELEDFIDEHDLEVKIKRKDDEDDVKEKIEDALREKYESSGGDDDLDEDDIDDMKKKALLKLIDERDLEIDEDDWDDVDELRDLIKEELDL